MDRPTRAWSSVASIVQWVELEEDRFGWYGPVIGPHPQTSQVGEWWVWAVGHCGLAGVARIWADCVGLVRAGRRPGAAATPKGVFWFCRTCGKYGRQRLQGLTEGCPGFTRDTGRACLRALTRGCHPVKAEGKRLESRWPGR